MHTGMRTRNWLCVVGLIAAGGTACGGGEKGVRRGPAGATAESAQLARLGLDVWQWTLPAHESGKLAATDEPAHVTAFRADD